GWTVALYDTGDALGQHGARFAVLAQQRRSLAEQHLREHLGVRRARSLQQASVVQRALDQARAVGSAVARGGQATAADHRSHDRDVVMGTRERASPKRLQLLVDVAERRATLALAQQAMSGAN